MKKRGESPSRMRRRLRAGPRNDDSGGVGGGTPGVSYSSFSASKIVRIDLEIQSVKKDAMNWGEGLAQ